jgi:hypothetical protein
MKASTAGAVAVRFNVYVCSDVPLDVVAGRVARALGVRLEERSSALRGTYFRWTGSGSADVLVQANVADEDGVVTEPEHAVHAALVYATGLDDGGYNALAHVEALRLLDQDILLFR